MTAGMRIPGEAGALQTRCCAHTELHRAACSGEAMSDAPWCDRGGRQGNREGDKPMRECKEVCAKADHVPG